MTDRARQGETIAAQAGQFIDAATGGVTPPTQLSVTFARDGKYELTNPAFIYGRAGNPTTTAAENLLASLEGAEAARLFPSGLAAANALLESLPPGARVVVPRVMYHVIQDRLRRLAAAGQIELALFDATRPGELEAAIAAGKTALVWIETPCNPTWDVTDIAAAGEAAHAAGARLAVDSTVATPVLTRPFALGADYVFHSATKYLNGHSDVLAGAVLSAEADAAWDKVCKARWLGGAVLGPFEAWLLICGMRTLYLRVRQFSENALAIARHFDGHDKVAAVLYPGLASHPSHDITARAEFFPPATSLGGVESLVEHRATIERPEGATPENLLRLSVGIEDADELIADLEQMLDGAP
ncbi:MAG: cystathionine gamma-synthase [Rhodospirillaceae bacterium]|nr:cystathionine gamma-synthase [Rhodospirillaceae bacterium]